MNALRSSGFASKIASNLPWPTITCISRPIPLSLNNSCISNNLVFSPFNKYSLVPFRNKTRVIVTSVKSIGSAPSVLSIVTETSALPNGARPLVPANMTSSIFPPRKDFAPCSPITHEIASTTFDFPEPFGPTTQVIPGSKLRFVEEAKDLNPFRLMLFKNMRRTYRLRLLLPPIYRWHFGQKCECRFANAIFLIFVRHRPHAKPSLP